MRRAAAFALAIALGAAAQEARTIPAFSSAAPGALPAGWKAQSLPRATPADVALVADESSTVLRVRSQRAAGGALHALRPPRAPQTLSWRWKVDRVVDGGDLTRRSGDDFAARVYVFFDMPLEALPFGERLRIRLARALFGEQLPTAALCYVWDNRHPAGTIAANPYTDRVRTFVLETGPARAGHWVPESRDLDADFRAAFAAEWREAAPAVSGIAAGNDTDQTGEAAVAWFGDFSLGPRP